MCATPGEGRGPRAEGQGPGAWPTPIHPASKRMPDRWPRPPCDTTTARGTMTAPATARPSYLSFRCLSLTSRGNPHSTLTQERPGSSAAAATGASCPAPTTPGPVAIHRQGQQHIPALSNCPEESAGVSGEVRWVPAGASDVCLWQAATLQPCLQHPSHCVTLPPPPSPLATVAAAPPTRRSPSLHSSCTSSWLSSLTITPILHLPASFLRCECNNFSAGASVITSAHCLPLYQHMLHLHPHQGIPWPSCSGQGLHIQQPLHYIQQGHAFIARHNDYRPARYTRGLGFPVHGWCPLLPAGTEQDSTVNNTEKA